ncbi:MAG: SAM-dependent methyltransferase [Rhodospirillaceae bacterium]|nr:SAM-dependent methyltransferase [Rhodospirillaceae bacterium]|tara:strand:- start:1188 stop:2078 length:891 start_codon:yes stop_codon:yes gene_type:complete
MTDLISIFDRKRLIRHRRRAAATFSDHDFLFQETAARLRERLKDIDRDFHASLELGARYPVLGNKASITVDIDPTLGKGKKLFASMDEEFLAFTPATLDLIISNLCLHWTNDLPGALLQIRKTLKPDGLFLAAMLGGETLKELRASLTQAELEIAGGAAPRVSPFVDIRDAGALLQRAGFALPVTDIDTINVTYENAFVLMKELRGMGETNALTCTPNSVPARALFPKAASLYQQRYANSNGRVTATFQILYLHGWGPDPSQQKALKPGSAKNLLADALNSREIAGGEKAKPGTKS